MANLAIVPAAPAAPFHLPANARVIVLDRAHGVVPSPVAYEHEIQPGETIYFFDINYMYDDFRRLDSEMKLYKFCQLIKNASSELENSVSLHGGRSGEPSRKALLKRFVTVTAVQIVCNMDSLLL